MKNFVLIATVALALMASCKKQKPEPENPPAPVPDPEIITSFRLLLTDSATGTQATYFFADPDGPGGGQAAYYGPSATVQSDSVITLKPQSVYFCRIVLLNETTQPVDTVSNEVNEEGNEHMLFYNHGSNSVVGTNPYAVVLAGSGLHITYKDLDKGNPARGIGLLTRWRSSAATGTAKHPLRITLRHQEGAKDGTFAPGETDVEVAFKLQVN